MKTKPQNVQIITIRDRKVMLDTDLARIYGVSTKRLNEQFRRNRKRFPRDFAFQLTAREAKAFSSVLALGDGSPNWSQTATSSRKHRGKAYRPWAFTEHGALQVANILRSDRAVAMSVYVIRAFVRLREKVASNTAILKRLAEVDKTLMVHDSALHDIYRKLLPLLTPPPERPRRQIGFVPWRDRMRVPFAPRAEPVANCDQFMVVATALWAVRGYARQQ
jgi:hypothetical protein